MAKYQQYEDRKDSGVETIGVVPEGWTVGRLKQFVDQNRQITYGIVQAGPNVKKGIPYIRPADMTEEAGVKDYGDLLRASPQIAAGYERSKIKTGDIICSIGPSFGKLMITPESLDGANLTQGTARVAISSKYNSRYFFWALRSTSSFQQWESSVGGATFRALNLGPLADTALVVPTKIEQKKIANFLDYQTAQIDTLIDKQQTLIQLLKEKRQAVISHAVTKGLNPDAPMKDSGIEWLGEVPEHWNVAGFKKYLNSIIDYRGKTPEKVDSGKFLVTARNIKKGEINYGASQEYVSEKDYPQVMSRGIPEIGDVLFTTEAPLGEVAQVDKTDIALAQRIIKFSGQNGILDNTYLKFYIMSNAFQDSLMTFATGSTALGIKSDRLSYLRQLIPPLKEQVLITEYIEIKSQTFDILIMKAEQAIQLMQERRTALISAAVTGKIDVRGWQAPNVIDDVEVEIESIT